MAATQSILGASCPQPIRVRESGNGIFIGQSVNRLTPMGWQWCSNTNWFVVCSCSCGNICVARAADIKRGAQQSCGCHRNEKSAENGRSCIRDEVFGRQKGNRLYGIWRGMMRRCHDVKFAAHELYGARGVEVCSDWHTYEAFRDWALANGYEATLTIDRFPNRSGNYEPTNCRWATWNEQARNKDATIEIEYRGARRSLPEWCEVLSLPYSRTKMRFYEGLPLDEVFASERLLPSRMRA